MAASRLHEGVLLEHFHEGYWSLIQPEQTGTTQECDLDLMIRTTCLNSDCLDARL